MPSEFLGQSDPCRCDRDFLATEVCSNTLKICMDPHLGSYQSASQRGATFEKFPATLKRTRDPSQEIDIHQFTKKQKIHSQAPPRPKSYVRTYSRKSNPKIREITIQDAVTQVDCPRDRSPVQLDLDRDSTPTGEIRTPVTQANDTIRKPIDAIKQEEKRTLRSQDGGSRSRSELASYFPNYDDIVSNEPKEPRTNAINPCLFTTADVYRIPRCRHTHTHHRRTGKISCSRLT